MCNTVNSIKFLCSFAILFYLVPFESNGLILEPYLTLATKSCKPIFASMSFKPEKADPACLLIDNLTQAVSHWAKENENEKKDIQITTNPESWRPNTESRFKLLQNGMEKMMLDFECQTIVFMFDQVNITAHKHVLTAMSPVFKSMLRNAHLNEYPINMSQIRESVPEGVRGMLKWFYTGMITGYEKNALHILKLAKEYKLYALILECEAILEEQINDGNAAELLFVADSLGAQHLKKGVFKFIQGNRHIVDSKAFQDKLTTLGGRLLAELIKAM